MNKILNLVRQPKYLVLADQAVASAGNFLTGLIIAKALGLVNFGYFASIWMFQFLIISLQNAFIISPMQIKVAFEEGESRQKYLTALTLWQLGWSVLMSVITISAISLKTSYLPQLAMQDMIFLLLWMWGYCWQDFLRKIFIALNKVYKAFWIDMITNFLQILWLVVEWQNEQLTFSLTIQIIVITFLPSVLLGLLFFRFKSTTVKQIKEVFVYHIKDGKWLSATALLQWFAGNYYLIVAAGALGVVALGAIRMAQNVLGVVSIFFQAFENYIPTRSAEQLSHSKKAFHQYLKNITSYLFGGIVALLLVMGIFAKPILEICGGGEYTQYTFVLRGFLVLNLFIFLGYPVRIAIRAMEMSRDIFIGYLLTTLISWLLGPWIIDELGITGVITGLLINQLVLIGYLYVRLTYQLKLSSTRLV
jgi:O-antigen/teichoic acid export membrane protein